MIFTSQNELKDSLAATEQGKSITEERQQVLIQDNEDLKETLAIMKEELVSYLKLLIKRLIPLVSCPNDLKLWLIFRNLI